MKKTLWMVKTGMAVAAGLCLAIAVSAQAEGTNLTELLQAGLFAEQGDHNLDAAIADYQMLATQYDKDRQLAATAIFRLGECYRAQNRTNEAAAQYHRVLKDFADQKVLATMSEQNLKGLGIGVETGSSFQQRLNTIMLAGTGELKQAGAGELKLAPAGNVPTPWIPTPQDVQELQMVKRVQQMPFPDIIQQAPTLIPDATLNNLINQYNQSDLDILRLKTNYGPDSQQMKSALQVEEGLKEKIMERLEGLKQALATALGSVGSMGGPVPPPNSSAEAINNQRLQTSMSVVSNDEDKEIQRIQDLIQNSPDLINRPDADSHTPLVKAAKNGWLKVAAYLLDHGAEVNPSDHSEPPLCAAAGVGNRTMVEFLLKRGAQVDATGLSGDTALMVAVKKRYATVVNVLLTNGADVNVRNQDTDTPLLLAVDGPASIVQRLLEAGANVNVEGHAWWSPLNKAIGSGLADTIKLLLDAKADVNTPHNGELPLCMAVALRDTNIVKLLLENGADPNLADKNGRTALSYAAEQGKADCVKVLLAAKADPNGGNSTLPLMAAVGANDLKSAQLLLEAGADPNQFKRFSMDLHRSVYADFMNHQDNMNALWLAVYLEQPEMVRLLAAHKADLGDSSDYGHSILFRTVTRTNLLAILLGAGGNPNARNLNDNRNYTLIQNAVDSEVATAVSLLLQHGADPNLTDTSGDTALHRALYLTAYRGEETNMVPLLLEHGANPNIRNLSGRTPLMIVKDSQYRFFVPWLIDLLHQHGALDKLPDWDRIEVSRADANFLEPVFFKATNDWNHFTLCETLLNCYDHAGPPYGPSFPDFSRITIIRPSRNSTNESRIKINLLNDAGQVDGTKDVSLEFGDVVEIPERDHALGENFNGLPQSDRDALANPLRGHVSLVVKGRSTSLEIYPEPQWSLLKNILADNTARSVLLASSDLSRVKVTRHDKASGKETTWTVDCSSHEASRTSPGGAGIPIPMSPGISSTPTFQMRLNSILANSGGNPTYQEPGSDLWLRDGDIVEVPEKP